MPDPETLIQALQIFAALLLIAAGCGFLGLLSWLVLALRWVWPQVLEQLRDGVRVRVVGGRLDGEILSYEAPREDRWDGAHELAVVRLEAGDDES